MWTGMMAFVRGVISALDSAGSILQVGPMSAKTGVAPRCMITLAVAEKVSGVVMTSSPGPMPSAARARCSPAVAELTATVCCAPMYSANRARIPSARPGG